VLKTSSNSLKCKYGFSNSKPWKVSKSWIIPDLKLKWKASGGKTIYDGAHVLVGFMWFLSVLTQLFILFSLWIDWLSSSTMFSKEYKDFLESLPLNVRVQTLMQVQKKRKRKGKWKRTEIRKTNKSEKKRK